MQAMEDARKAGKTRFIGLSAVRSFPFSLSIRRYFVSSPLLTLLNVLISQMSAATLRRAAKVARIDFVEMEFSPFETGIEVRLIFSPSL